MTLCVVKDLFVFVVLKRGYRNYSELGFHQAEEIEKKMYPVTVKAQNNLLGHDRYAI